MGNHLSALKNLARESFDPEFNFRNSETDPEELILLKFHPMDSEGFYMEESIKIFDWSRSGFLFREIYKESDFETARVNFRKSFLPKQCFGVIEPNAILAERVTVQRKLFRPQPINWSNFDFVSITPWIESHGELVYLANETNDFEYRKTSLEVLRYLSNIRRQILVGILLNKLEFDAKTTGCYTNPLGPFTDGILVPFIKPELANGAEWLKNFDFANDLRVTLPEWFEKMSRDSEAHFEKFYLFMKLSICAFRNKLQLENERHYHHEREESTLIANLKTYNSLLSLLVGLMKKVNSKLWTRLRKTEKALAQLLETILSE